MVMSVTNAAMVINHKKSEEKLEEEDEMKLFLELVQKHYLEKIEIIRKELLQ